MKARILHINMKFYAGLPRGQECILVLREEKKGKEYLESA